MSPYYKKINTEMEIKYKIMDEKIKRLVQNHAHKPKTDINFYPRVVNTSDTSANEDNSFRNHIH